MGIAGGQDTHNKWMQQAMELAHYARDLGEVPVGSVIVYNDEVVGRGWNEPIGQCDATRHAEIAAIRSANKVLGNYRLPKTVLYTTLEPCVMCAGALVHARIDTLVYGAPDPKAGAAGSVFNLLQSSDLNHQVGIVSGVLAEASGELLREFFRERRSNS